MPFFDSFFDSKMTFVGRWLEQSVTRALLRRLERFVPKRARILELGPGKGAFGRLCVQRGHEYRAIEANHQSCEALRAAGLDVTEGFVPPLPRADVKYDAICVFALLEHMPSVQAATQLIEESRDQLAPGGVLAIMSPELRGWGFNFWACDVTHSFPTSAQSVVFMFHDAGLTPVFCRFMCGPFMGLARFPIWLVNKLNPWGIEEAVLGPRYPARRLRKLKMGLSECFVLFGRKGGASPE